MTESDDHAGPIREWLTDVELEAITGRSRKSWRRDRLLMRGPRYRKLGRCVRYRRSDVEEWLNSRPYGGEQLRGR